MQCSHRVQNWCLCCVKWCVAMWPSAENSHSLIGRQSGQSWPKDDPEDWRKAWVRLASCRAWSRGKRMMEFAWANPVWPGIELGQSPDLPAGVVVFYKDLYYVNYAPRILWH